MLTLSGSLAFHLIRVFVVYVLFIFLPVTMDKSDVEEWGNVSGLTKERRACICTCDMKEQLTIDIAFHHHDDVTIGEGGFNCLEKSLIITSAVFLLIAIIVKMAIFYRTASVKPSREIDRQALLKA